jgi:hypothetical protein
MKKISFALPENDSSEYEFLTLASRKTYLMQFCVNLAVTGMTL